MREEASQRDHAERQEGRDAQHGEKGEGGGRDPALDGGEQGRGVHAAVRNEGEQVRRGRQISR